jgi:hypothetical protein
MTVTLPDSGPAVHVSPTDVVIDRAPLRVELALRPFGITVRRDGRRLLRGGGVWVAEGEVHDQLIHLTEGVITREERSAPERACRATLTSCEADAVELELTLSGERAAHLRVGVPTDDRVEFTLAADGVPLRLAIDWDQRAEERFVGLGARHGTRLDSRMGPPGLDHRHLPGRARRARPGRHAGSGAAARGHPVGRARTRKRDRGPRRRDPSELAAWPLVGIGRPRGQLRATLVSCLPNSHAVCVRLDAPGRRR